MEKLLKLTKENGELVLIGVESIIDVKFDKYQPNLTKIQSRGAMVETNFVKETPKEIFEMYKNSKSEK